MIIEIESDFRETGISCPLCGSMTYSDGAQRPRCADCLAALKDEYIWRWLIRESVEDLISSEAAIASGEAYDRLERQEEVVK